MKKKIHILLIALMLCTCISPLTSISASADIAVDHVIINQVYGGSDDGVASHSFIELYNPTDKDVDMSTWSIQYRSSSEGKNATDWEVFNLSGTIKAGGYYLIRCGATTGTTYMVPAGNQEWNMELNNKGLSVALMSNRTKLDKDTFVGDVTQITAPEGLVDLAAAQGNDKADTQMPYAYEGTVTSIQSNAVQSKKKAIRRVAFADTDDNGKDFAAVDYSKTVTAENGPHTGEAPTTGGDDSGTVPPSTNTPTYTGVTTTNTKYTGIFNKIASLDATLIARYNAGAISADGGSEEIVYYSSYNQFAYAVNGVKGVIDAVPLNVLATSDTVQSLNGNEISVKDLVAGKDASFTYGDMTSIAISHDGKTLAVALQDEDYTKTGRVAVFTCESNGDLTYKTMVTVGVQPDMVTFNDDGSLILSANEGEPRQGYGSGAVDPAGSVSIINTSTYTATEANFNSFDSQRQALSDKGIVLKKDTNPSVDLEPEYISVSGNNAYVSLQEANAIAVLDLSTGQFTNIYSVGFEDFSKTAVDLDKSDKTYNPTTYSNIKGIRMPDGITTTTIGGQTYLMTANEGDSRAWPVETEAYSNEYKKKISPVNSIEFSEKVTWFDTTQYDGLEAGMDYIFGGRSFTMFKVTDSGLEEVYDSGAEFELTTATALPNYFNCSNDNVDIEDRSGKKGPEPETVTTGTIDGKTYAFITLERIGGVMIYDITDPSNVTFTNYMNSRDYSEAIKDDVSAEGLYFVNSSKSPTDTPLLLAANEVSGTLSVTELNYQKVNNVVADTDVDQNKATTVDSGFTPKTGDNTMLFFYIAIVLAASLVSLTAFYAKKGKDK